MRIIRLKDEPWQDQDLGGKRPGKSVCIVRYGGFGDMLQMSSILPWLKGQGYFITLNTTDQGYEIIKHDPHVDEVILQKHDQVPNQELSEYWAKMAKSFRKFVQLSESIEGSLLALPGREEYAWKPKYRHTRMNVDYFHRMHDIAGVPMPPKPKFYPTKEEKNRAKSFMQKHDGSFVIMWVLCGSTVHKAWPFTDSVIARLMTDHPEVKIVFVGEELCQLLEDGWRDEPRVIRTSGVLNIREVLALSQRVDMVVGPETGVLNCVAFEKKIPKIIMLSHSSPVNIGGSWKNTTCMIPRGCECYPCHKMHYGWKTCNRDEITGGAKCAAMIHPVQVYEAIAKHLPRRLAA